jgi:S-adenosylmethionine decarboxylase
MKHSAGVHIILDGFVKDPSVFNSDDLTSTFKKLAEALEMNIIMGPDFLEVPLDPTKLQSDVFQDEGGITGMCVISTSHMSIHCWPIRKCFSMDVFSCKDFDSDKAKQIIWDLLGVESGDYMVVNRTFPDKSV